MPSIARQPSPASQPLRARAESPHTPPLRAEGPPGLASHLEAEEYAGLLDAGEHVQLEAETLEQPRHLAQAGPVNLAIQTEHSQIVAVRHASGAGATREAAKRGRRRIRREQTNLHVVVV